MLLVGQKKANKGGNIDTMLNIYNSANNTYNSAPSSKFIRYHLLRK